MDLDSRIHISREIRSFISWLTHDLATRKRGGSLIAHSSNEVFALAGKRAIDVGAGEGYFLDLLKGSFFGADSLWGTEYNASAAEKIENKGFNVYNGEHTRCGLRYE